MLGGGGDSQPRRPMGRMLGVFLDENIVEEVLPDTAAEKAGLKAGDKVIEVAGNEVTDRRSLVRAIRTEGEKKKVIVMRDGKKVELTVEWQRRRPSQNSSEPEPPKEEEKPKEEKSINLK
ncbi:MAG: PDZ domain-containing protein, partial [Planctomycetota bacterium]|nr:PDZ domain-containing protein [Planctomycetota bacterium]